MTNTYSLTARHDDDRFANDIGGPGIEYDIPINGLFQIYWSNGNLRYEWYYKDGKRADGVSRGWWPNGKLKQMIIRKDGKKDGLETTWHENGQKMYEGTYVYGIEVGKWTAYNEDGTVKTVWEESKYTQGLTLKRKVK